MMPNRNDDHTNGGPTMKVLFGSALMSLEKSIPELQQKYPDIHFEFCPNRDEVADVIGDVDIYVGYVNSDIVQAAKNLKWIQSP